MNKDLIRERLSDTIETIDEIKTKLELFSSVFGNQFRVR